MRFFVFLENDNTDLRQFFFQDLRENTCSLQPSLKCMHPAVKAPFLRRPCDHIAWSMFKSHPHRTRCWVLG